MPRAEDRKKKEIQQGMLFQGMTYDRRKLVLSSLREGIVKGFVVFEKQGLEFFARGKRRDISEVVYGK